MNKYIPADLLDEAKLAIKSHVPIGDIARRLGIEVDDLRNRLNLPSLKPIPTDADSSVDLWAADELNARL